MRTKTTTSKFAAKLLPNNHTPMRRRSHTPCRHTQMSGYCIFASLTRLYLTPTRLPCQSPVLGTRSLVVSEFWDGLSRQLLGGFPAHLENFWRPVCKCSALTLSSWRVESKPSSRITECHCGASQFGSCSKSFVINRLDRIHRAVIGGGVATVLFSPILQL